ncbi:MAG: M28 family peptidase [Anaerolineales bacterium]|jgi:Zn-dependent M28 family amino/carboxypeptidase|nr:M28 family peptidase [Anaerolineales bacterium]
MKKQHLWIGASALAILLAGCAGLPPVALAFDGERAYAHVLAQDGFGPRTPGSPAHAQLIEYAQTEFEAQGWNVTLQKTERMGHPITNILATRQERPPVLLMAHYDSRFFADNDPDPANQMAAVPGANDGASGVAVLLELARVLPPGAPVGLLLLDAEDQGRIAGWDWILGSRAFAEALDYQPEAVILLDMIGDANLNIFQERNSDPGLTAELWAAAKGLGYEQFFIAEDKYTVIDDHIPFLEKGIRAVDLIDFDYPYWHTLQDTPDKVSADSLQIVGEVLLAWLDQFATLP